jgi:hypothetical protein
MAVFYNRLKTPFFDRVHCRLVEGVARLCPSHQNVRYYAIRANRKLDFDRSADISPLCRARIDRLNIAGSDQCADRYQFIGDGLLAAAVVG